MLVRCDLPHSHTNGMWLPVMNGRKRLSPSSLRPSRYPPGTDHGPLCILRGELSPWSPRLLQGC